MNENSPSPAAESLDPRVKRTRQMLYRAFGELLAEKSFEEISVHDITTRSTLNRATFYDHFTDKFALLESLIRDRFEMRFMARMAGGSGLCSESARQLVLTVCDFFSEWIPDCQQRQRQFGPLVESQIKVVVRDFLLAGLQKHAPPGEISPGELKLRATMASGAICGAVLEWNRVREQTADQLVAAVLPATAAILQGK